MGDGVGVPPFGQHGDGDDATDVFAELSFLADRVHDLAQEIGIGDLAGLLDVATLDHFAPEPFDFLAGHFAEILVQGLARFELLAIDEEGARGARRLPDSS